MFNMDFFTQKTAPPRFLSGIKKTYLKTEKFLLIKLKILPIQQRVTVSVVKKIRKFSWVLCKAWNMTAFRNPLLRSFLVPEKKAMEFWGFVCFFLGVRCRTEHPEDAETFVDIF